MIFNLALDHWLSDTDRLNEIFGSMPELPPPSTLIWAAQTKAAVIEAVRGGWVPIEEVCRLYMISVDEFVSWEHDLDQLHPHRLRITR